MIEPKDMTQEEILDQLIKYCTEHDLDCEEGGPKDRCPVCLLQALKKKTE
mgnify:CR=1 FL=1